MIRQASYVLFTQTYSEFVLMIHLSDCLKVIVIWIQQPMWNQRQNCVLSLSSLYLCSHEDCEAWIPADG